MIYFDIDTRPIHFVCFLFKLLLAGTHTCIKSEPCVIPTEVDKQHTCTVVSRYAYNNIRVTLIGDCVTSL